MDDGKSSFARRRRRPSCDVTAEYERLPRSQNVFTKRAKEVSKLPIILPTGESKIPTDGGDVKRQKRSNAIVRKREAISKNGLSEDECDVAKDANEDADENAVVMSKSQLRRLEQLRRDMEKQNRETKKVRVPKTKMEKEKEEVQQCLKRIVSRKDALRELAVHCELLLADPQTHVFRLDILWAVARGHCDTQPIDQLTIEEAKRQPSTLALLSMGAVLQNCIVGYKIRPVTDTTPLSRSVVAVQSYETRLLSIYERFVSLLVERFRSHMDLVMPVVSGLLLASPTFNCSDTLLRLCINAASSNPVNDRRGSAVGSRIAMECLHTLVEQDATLDVAVRVARALGQVMKPSRGGTKQRTVLKGALLRMLATIRFAEKETLVQRETALRGTCDADHVDTEVYKELMQSSIYGDIHAFKKNKTEIIRELCVMFLRILRSPDKYPPDTLDASVDALGHLGDEVHTSLVAEIIDELRRLVTEDGSRLGPGVMFSAITSVARMSSFVSKDAEVKTDLSWVTTALTYAIFTALPRFVSTSSVASIVLPPTSSFFRPPHSAPVEEVHPEDRSYFMHHFKEAIAVLLQTPAVFDRGSTTSKDLVYLVQALFVTSCHIADAVCRVALLELVTTLMKRYPALTSLMDADGTILYGTGEEVSLFWTASLLANTWTTPTATTHRLCRDLLSLPQKSM